MSQKRLNRWAWDWVCGHKWLVIHHFLECVSVYVCVLCVVCLAPLSAQLSRSPCVSSFVSVISVYLHETYSTCIQRGCVHLMCLGSLLLSVPRGPQTAAAVPRDRCVIRRRAEWSLTPLTIVFGCRFQISSFLAARRTGNSLVRWSTETNRHVKLSPTINPLETPMPKRCLGYEWEPREAGAEPTRLPITKEWHEKRNPRW